MKTIKIGRREFMKGTASAAALVSFPGIVLGQTPGPRLEWQQFKTTPQYASYFNAIRTMRANNNANSRSSWQFWINAHVNNCPHDIAYFLAWHRGYLYYFEQQLRIVSGDSSLTLPYWDYYTNPNIPSEFTDPVASNPLYVPRSGTNVYNALDLSPFDPGVWNFQRGTQNAFETRIEAAPHNPVHNLIGGVMATMQSPLDPIFFLHHGNIDRLMHAWALPDGKGIPYTTNPYSAATSSPYWSGNLTYANNLTMPRFRTYHPAWLNFSYDNNNKPTSLPPQTLKNPIIRVQAQREPLLNRPAVGEFESSPGRVISAQRRSLGGVANVGLAERSVSARIALPAPAAQSLQNTLSRVAGASRPVPADVPQSVKIVLDNVIVTGSGRNGGYFYNVYLNLPASGDSTAARKKFFLGTLGAFEIASAAHHGPAKIEFPATEVLLNMGASDFREVVLSMVRVNGENPPSGQTMRIGEIRAELSTEQAWDRSPPVQRPPNACYC